MGARRVSELKPGEPRRLARIAPWLLVAAGILVYANSLEGPFIFDDLGAIVDNPDIRQVWPLWRDPGSTPRPSLNSRPIVRLSLALNYAAGGLEVRGYHAFNIAVHILAALVLFGIVQRTLRHPGISGHFEGMADNLALTCALLWLVHPLQTQSVDYILQRSESIMGLFYLLTLYAAIRVMEADRAHAWRTIAILAAALGMASKEAMVTAPVVVLIYDRVFWADSWTGIWRRRWGLYAGLAGTWAILAAQMSSGPHGDSVGFAAGVSAWDYALNQCAMIVGYLQKAFWPDPLVLDYGFVQPLTISAVWPHASLLVALLALTAAALWYRPMIAFPGVWFFAILGPTSSFVPIVNEVGAERRAYLSLAGLIALVVIGGYFALEWVAQRWQLVGGKVRVGRGVLVLVLSVGLSYATMQRNQAFCSSLSIWQTVVEAAPHNPRGHTYLGLALDALGRSEEAIGHYRRALQLNPDFAEAHINLGIALGVRGQAEEAIQHFRQALRLRPDYAEVHSNFGNVLVNTGRLDEAIAHYRRALQLRPGYAEAHNNLGTALGMQGQVEEAIRHFQQALQLRPDYAEAHNNLGIARRAQAEAGTAR